VHFIVFPRGTLIDLDKDRLSLLRHKGYEFKMVNMSPIHISSTELREKMKSMQPVGASIPTVVMEYIKNNDSELFHIINELFNSNDLNKLPLHIINEI